MKPKIESKTALIIEDSEVCARTLSSLLSRKGIKSQIAYSYSQAMNTKKVNIIFLDHFLWGKTGDKLIPELRKKYPNVMIIAYTGGMITIKDAKFYLDAGYDDVLPKPVSVDYLEDLLEVYGVAVRSLR